MEFIFTRCQSCFSRDRHRRGAGRLVRFTHRSIFGSRPASAREQQLFTAGLMRIDLIGTFIFSISGLVIAALQANQHFFLPALAPIMYNVGQIFGAAILAPSHSYSIGRITIPAFGLGVYGLVYGVILGAALHLAIQIPGLIRYGFRWTASLDLRDPALVEMYILWLVAIIVMICSYIRDWFFPIVAFAVVGGHFFWAAASFVLAVKQPRKNRIRIPWDDSRSFWAYDRASGGFFIKAGGGRWFEIRDDGKPPFSFREGERTADHIDLIDDERSGLEVRLHADCRQTRARNSVWIDNQPGQWATGITLYSAGESVPTAGEADLAGHYEVAWSPQSIFYLALLGPRKLPLLRGRRGFFRRPRQIARCDRASFAGHHRILNRVDQFPHVPGPVPLLQQPIASSRIPGVSRFFSAASFLT